jgi:hypothetical protein
MLLSILQITDRDKFHPDLLSFIRKYFIFLFINLFVNLFLFFLFENFTFNQIILINSDSYIAFSTIQPCTQKSLEHLFSIFSRLFIVKVFFFHFYEMIFKLKRINFSIIYKIRRSTKVARI